MLRSTHRRQPLAQRRAVIEAERRNGLRGHHQRVLQKAKQHQPPQRRALCHTEQQRGKDEREDQAGDGAAQRAAHMHFRRQLAFVGWVLIDREHGPQSQARHWMAGYARSDHVAGVVPERREPVQQRGSSAGGQRFSKAQSKQQPRRQRQPHPQQQRAGQRCAVNRDVQAKNAHVVSLLLRHAQLFHLPLQRGRQAFFN